MLESVNNFKSEQVVARSKGAATDVGSVGSNKTSSTPHLVENDAKQYGLQKYRSTRINALQISSA